VYLACLIGDPDAVIELSVYLLEKLEQHGNIRREAIKKKKDDPDRSSVIRRSDVAKLLDDIEDANGPSAADHVLAIVRGVMNWYATRSDNYVVPIARGMRRTDPADRARDRILDDDEIRAVWIAAEANGKFGAILRLALMTAQRRDKLATMRWNDVSVDGIWNIRTEDREKGNAGALVLAGLLETILHPPGENVVELHEAASS